jgi:hypothetical protein
MPPPVERKSNVKLVKRSSSNGGNAYTKFMGDFLVSIFGRTAPRQFATVGGILVVIVAYVFYQRSMFDIKDFTALDGESLKDILVGEKPYMFFCAREQNAVVPPIFSDLNVLKGTKMGFAKVNCSQVLPSGKSIWDRFKLKKEWKPTIFGTAPWSKPMQAHPTNLKDVAALKKFVDDELGPKGMAVKSDKALWQYCAFQKNPVYDDRDISDSCIVILKGTKFTNAQFLLEQRLVQQFPKVKFVSVDAAKLRLSFEDIDTLPADHFAMKLHALRNGTHFMSMVNPSTWDYLQTFVSVAVASPLYDYSGDGNFPFQLMKTKDLRAKKARDEKRKEKSSPSSGKKNKKTTPPATGSKRQQTDKTAKKPSATGSKRQSGSIIPEEKSKGSDEEDEEDEEEEDDEVDEEPAKPSSHNQPPPAAPEDPEAARAEQLRREHLRREQMEAQQRQYLFEEAAGDEENSVEEVSEDEDDSIIEL